MPTDCIPFRDTNYFSSLICDYLDEHQELQPFYNRFPKLENFKDQINEKTTSYSTANRNVLFSALKKQYEHVKTSKATYDNIALLKEPNTFTIATGHQLNLFTGPLYFLYKIISTINLTKELKAKHPNLRVSLTALNNDVNRQLYCSDAQGINKQDTKRLIKLIGILKKQTNKPPL